MVIRGGEIWWAELSEPAGSEPGYRRPVLVIQTDGFNRSRIATVMVVITSNVKLAEAPGNVFLPKKATGLGKDSVANVSQVITVDKNVLTEKKRGNTGLTSGSNRGWIATGDRIVNVILR